MNIRQVTILFALGVSLSFWIPPQPMAEAKTQITAGTIQEVDPQTVKELLATFELAEQAMQARDLEGIESGDDNVRRIRAIAGTAETMVRLRDADVLGIAALRIR